MNQWNINNKGVLEILFIVSPAAGLSQQCASFIAFAL